MVGGSATAGGWALNIYHDFDPKVCAWAEQLVAAGHVAPGTVLCKRFKDVAADEIRHATQGKCHCTYKFYQPHQNADGAVQASGTITISAEQFAAWLESEECAKWRVSTVAGLQAELAKARARIRTLEAKKATGEVFLERKLA